MLTFDDSVDDETLDKLLDDLDGAGYNWDEPTDELTVTMPRDLFTDQALANLRQVIANKETLLMHALETDSLEINEDEDTIGERWRSIMFTRHMMQSSHRLFLTRCRRCWNIRNPARFTR